MRQKKQWARAALLEQQFATLADEVAKALDELVHVSAIEERFPDDGGSVVVITPHPWRWAPLADADLSKLSSAREAVQRWRRECVATLRVIGPEFEPDFVDEIEALESIVDRSGRGAGPSADTLERILTYAHEALARQRDALRLAGIALGPVGGETLLVPDTNALYGNPYLDEWGAPSRRRSSSSRR
jgi:hypothetical protein